MTVSPANTEPLVSISTPVFNGEPFLRECIESVLAQTYTNWDFTIVDNCSTDATRAIAEEYARRDSRIHVHVNTRFVPVLENHNIAASLISARAAFWKPLMADDWLFPECIGRMVVAAGVSDSIGLVCSYAFDGVNVMWTGMPFPAECVSGREVCRDALLKGGYIFGTPSSMLLRADLVRKRRPFYNEINLHADQESAFDVLRESQFAFVHQVLSLNRVHDRSQSAAVEHLDSMFVGTMYVFHKYGRDYLSAAEFAQMAPVMLDRYYRVLAVGALGWRGPEYWVFHRKKLALLGRSLERTRLARYVIAEGMARLACPPNVLRGIRRALRRRRI